ncbi:MAG: hypothetical protein NC310_08300 [Roseburia sp.]|nr:hypothetical protein [Roseburia sp.]MCM1557006.1 hypothetical protein [Anaeroplasma bactoclasticum]
MNKNIIKKGKLFIITLLVVLAFFALFTGKTMSMHAEEETKSNKISQQVFGDESTIQTLNNIENYHYSNAIDPKFIIKDVDGTISITEEIVVEFEGEKVVIPNFNFYRIIDANNETRFYQADTITDNPAHSAFAYIGILPPSIELNSENYVMYLQYGVEEILTLNNVKIVLNELEFDYFDSISKPLVLSNDDLSQRLKTSRKVSKYGAYEEEYAKSKQSSPQKTMNSIQSNSYDSYTNSDGIIHNYVNDYFGKHFTQEGLITDDPIVQIIPKDLCFILGEHFYIGKEYGFFIKVMIDDTVREDYEVDIFVFDIQNIIPSFPSNVTGSTKVVPLFQYKYRAMDRNRRDNWVDHDQSLTRIVIRHYVYDAAEYYMNDICFRHSISNPTLLNLGDDGYDPYEDDGAFIIQNRYNSSGVGLKKKSGSFLHDTILFACGFNQMTSFVTNIYSYVYNVCYGFGQNGGYLYTHEPIKSDNEACIDTKETNNIDQINARGNLIKSVTTTLCSDEGSPKLIHVGGGYAESKYVVARRSGSNYNKIHVVTSISANVVEDNTSRYWFFGWHEDGSIENYGRTTGTYQISNYERIKDVSTSADASLDVTTEQKHKIAKFVPKVSGKYRFETLLSYGDPNFTLIDATTNTAYNATDDIDGTNNRNARLDIDILAGHVYYIDAFCYGLADGQYSLRIFLFSETLITRNIDYSCKAEKEVFIMYKFIPDFTGYYDIFMISQSGDPYLFLFDSNGNKISENDDGIEEDNLNPLITYCLDADKVYYIAVQGYNGIREINGTLKVTPSIVNCEKIFINEEVIVSVDPYTSMFEFTAPYTGKFDFYTYDCMDDPYLELYNSNRELIAINDDDELNEEDPANSLITINLISGQKYYLHAKSYAGLALYRLTIEASKSS